MGQDPSRIDRQIEANREHIAATLDAIGYKANIPARISEQSDVILSDAVGLVDSVATRITEATAVPGRALPRGFSIRAASFVPFAVAYLIGMLVGLTWPKAT